MITVCVRGGGERGREGDGGAGGSVTLSLPMLLILNKPYHGI